MNRARIRICDCLLMVTGVSASLSGIALAKDAPQLSGSYRIIDRADRGGETRVRLRLHLVNRSARDLRIQRITLWDFSHPTKGGTQSCSIVVHPASSAATKQQFIVPRSELDLWRRGTRPRIVLEGVSPDGHLATVVVRLDRISGGKGN